ncbi:MAG TPA: hypothetical protein VNU45_15445 [Rummeliibacillus sp.]|nr:hypothetical protein [Rummeliibacillus sp.]
MDTFLWSSKGIDLLYFLPSLILLIVVMVACVGIYVVIFIKRLSPNLFKFFLIPIALLGLLIWAIPMDMGFYEFFRAIL